jgi:hypothetical protein
MGLTWSSGFGVLLLGVFVLFVSRTGSFFEFLAFGDVSIIPEC